MRPSSRARKAEVLKLEHRNNEKKGHYANIRGRAANITTMQVNTNLGIKSISTKYMRELCINQLIYNEIIVFLPLDQVQTNISR